MSFLYILQFYCGITIKAEWLDTISWTNATEIGLYIQYSDFCLYFSCRLVELLPSVHIPRYWGITAKCLSYSKTSSDPFVYCLLRQQYRKVLVSTISRVLRKDKYLLSVHSTSSMLDTTEDNCIARITWAWCANIWMIQHLHTFCRKVRGQGLWRAAALQKGVLLKDTLTHGWTTGSLKPWCSPLGELWRTWNNVRSMRLHTVPKAFSDSTDCCFHRAGQFTCWGIAKNTPHKAHNTMFITMISENVQLK